MSFIDGVIAPASSWQSLRDRPHSISRRPTRDTDIGLSSDERSLLLPTCLDPGESLSLSLDSHCNISLPDSQACCPSEANVAPASAGGSLGVWLLRVTGMHKPHTHTNPYSMYMYLFASTHASAPPRTPTSFRLASSDSLIKGITW